jgi:hypothetical protein
MPLNILFLFFRNFLWLTTSITLFECYLFSFATDPQVIMVLLWTKLASDFVIGLLFVLLQGNRLFFFHNLGYSRFKLMGSALFFDMTLWTLLITGTALMT